MSSPKRTLPPIQRPPRKPRRCGVCGTIGHDKRNCPVAPAQVATSVVATHVFGTNPVPTAASLPPFIITDVPDDSSVDWEKTLYVVFDLETTGRRRFKDEIIELAAVVLNKFGVPIEDAMFAEFVKPTTTIPPFITELTTTFCAGSTTFFGRNPHSSLWEDEVQG